MQGTLLEAANHLMKRFSQQVCVVHLQYHKTLSLLKQHLAFKTQSFKIKAYETIKLFAPAKLTTPLPSIL